MTDERIQAAASIAELEAERDNHTASLMEAATARITQLEAEREKWHGDAVTQMKLKIKAEDRIAELEAEVKRVRNEEWGPSAAAARIADLEDELAGFAIGAAHAQQGLRAAVLAERVACRDIALAIDSGRGNEKEIAAAIMRRGT